MNVWFLLPVFITVGCFGVRLSVRISHKRGAGLCLLAGFWKAGMHVGGPLLLCPSKDVQRRARPGCVGAVSSRSLLNFAGLWGAEQPWETAGGCCGRAAGPDEPRGPCQGRGVPCAGPASIPRAGRPPATGELCSSFMAAGVLSHAGINRPGLFSVCLGETFPGNCVK